MEEGIKNLVLWIIPLKDVLQWTMAIEIMLKEIGMMMLKGDEMDDKVERGKKVCKGLDDRD